MQRRLLEMNPNSFRKMVATFLEANGRGYWTRLRRILRSSATCTWRLRTKLRVSKSEGNFLWRLRAKNTSMRCSARIRPHMPSRTDRERGREIEMMMMMMKKKRRNEKRKTKTRIPDDDEYDVMMTISPYIYAHKNTSRRRTKK